MKWSNLNPFRRRPSSEDAAKAVQDAEKSRSRAFNDRDAAAEQRVEAEHWAAQVKAHNTANRFDDWLARVVQQGRNN